MVGTESMKLHSYQESTVSKLYESTAVCAVVPMGGGKTVSTLTAIKELIEDGEISRAIVWGPKWVALKVWTDEAAKWPHLRGLRVVTVTGKTPAQRQKIIDGEWDVLVINYELATWLKDLGKLATSDMVSVFDEVTRLKSNTSSRRKDVLHITNNSARWGLTGTPKGNRAIDLWGIADALVPGCWGPFQQWRARFFRPVDQDGHIWKIHQGCEEIIDDMFARLAFKVDKSEIPNNPEAQPIIREFTLPPRAMNEYRDFRDEMVFDLEDGEITVEHAAALSMKLRQVASGFIYHEDGVTYDIIHNNRLDLFCELVEGNPGENLLGLYQFQAELDMIRERFPDARVLGGETSDREAMAIMEEWNAGEIPLLLGHPASMGHGLNLQHGGNNLIWYSLPWSLEQYMQTNDRLARQGQRFQVYAYHLIAEGTIDRAVYRALREKRELQDELIEMLRAA